MFKTLITTATIMFAAAIARAQTDYDNGMNYYLQQNAMLTERMQATENSIVQTNLNNPQVQAMYQQHMAQGGGMNAQQFAYMYGATAGFTPQGIGYYNQTTMDITRRDTAALQAYHNHVNGLWAETNAYRNQVNDRIAEGRGHLLSGTGSFADPYSGQTYTLPVNVPAGTWTYDSGSWNNFQIDSQGSYWMGKDDGWMTQMDGW